MVVLLAGQNYAGMVRGSEVGHGRVSRCRIYARVFLRSPLFAGHGSEEEYANLAREVRCAHPASAFRPITVV